MLGNIRASCQLKAKVMPAIRALPIMRYSSAHSTTKAQPKYESIHDIPDEMVPTTSWRDPDNPIYRTRRFVNLRKKQILYAQDPDVPGYLKTKQNRYLYYFTYAFALLNSIYLYRCYKVNAK